MTVKNASLETKAKAREYYKKYYALHRKKLIARAVASTKKRRELNRKPRKVRPKMSIEEKRRKAKERFERSGGKYAATAKKYKQDHKDEIRIHQRNYFRRADVKAKLAPYQKEYRIKNKKWIRAKQIAFFKKFPEKQRSRSRAYKARKKKAQIGNLKIIQKWERSWRSLEVVLCFWCKHYFLPSKCHMDHIVALKIGGPHSIENLCISCGSCNCSKQDKTLEDWNKSIEEPVLF